MNVPLTTADFLNRAELVYGDRIGLIDEPDQPGGSWGDVTYRDLARRARAFSAAMEALGIAQGDRIAIVSPNGARFLAALYGACMAGRILVPINFRLNPQEIDYIIKHSGARVFLIDPELDEATKDIPIEHRFILGSETDDELFGSTAAPTPVTIAEDDVATINYTSGTTARPKGVMLTHRNLWLNATTFGWHTRISDRDRFLHVVPLFHCNGWGLPFALTGMGATQCFLRKFSGAELLNRVGAYGITYLNGAPAVVNGVLDAQQAHGGKAAGHGVTRMVGAGAPPPTRTLERMETELGWEALQIYGLTETSPLLTVNHSRAEHDSLSSHDRAAKIGRAGSPVIGTYTRISDQGEVLARSNHIMAGYWNDPVATNSAIVDNWFHTGDGGTMDDEGYVSISDRKKDVIISGGENVSSIEVEDCLMSHPAVAEVAVIGIPDDKWGETVKALVVLRPGSDASEQDLMAHCRSQLAHFKCPTSVELRDALHRTATGKLQKFKLRAPYWEGRTRQVN